MKKTLLIPFLFSFLFSFSQTIVNRGGPANTVADQRFQATKNLLLPRYADTGTANIAGLNLTINNIGIDSCGAKIFTYNPMAVWTRYCSPKRWVRDVNSENISQFIDSTQGGSDINISILNDSTLVICRGDGTCDTLHFTTSITNINSVQLITDSSISVCSVDTVSGGVVTICDTIIISQQPLVYFFQNWIYENPSRIVEGGTNPLLHNTTFPTGYYKAFMGGYPVYDYPINFYQDQFFQVGTGITSWINKGSYNDGSPTLNSVRFGINYTDSIYSTINNIPGFLGRNKNGYFLSTNIIGNGSYGMYMDDNTSKSSGIYFDTKGTGDTAIGIFGMKAPNAGTFLTRADTSFIALFSTDKNIRFTGYPNTRDDGVTPTVLYTDSKGNIRHGGVVAGSSITIINDTTINICSFGTSLCDTFIVNNVGSVQNVTILNDSTLLVCGETLCDTLHIPQTSFVESPLIIQNTLWVAKNGNDAQALRNRVDKPFLTIGAAWAAAQAGDVIKVFPGDYEMASTITLNKSVNFHFTGKGTLTLNTGVATALFVDAGGGQVNHFDAPGWTFRGRGTQRVFNLTGTDTLTIIADNLFASSVPTIETTTSGAAILTVNVDSAYSSGGSKTCIRQTNGTMYLTANVIMNYQGAGADNSALYLLGGAISYVRAKRIESAGAAGSDYAVLGGSLTAASRVYIDADLIKSVNDWAIFPTSSVPVAAEWHCKAKRIENTSDCTVVSGITDFTVQADEIVNNSADANIDGICHAEGGILYLIGARIIRTGTSGSVGRDLLTTAGGKLYYEGVAYKQNAVHEETPGDIKKMDSLSYGSRFRYTNSRMETDTTLATAANNLVLGKGNVVRVSGNTQINAIDSTEWQPGSVIRLIFSGTPVVKNNTSGGAGTIPIKLAGGTDFSAAAGDVLTLVEDSQFWRESARTVTASVGGVTGDNAITINPSGNVRLGSVTNSDADHPLLYTSYINTTTFSLDVRTGSPGVSPLVAEATTGSAVYGYTSGTGGIGVTGQADGVNGFGVVGNGYYGVQGFANTSAGLAGGWFQGKASNSAVTTAIKITHNTSGPAYTAGVGSSISFEGTANSGGGVTRVKNELKSIWTDPADATRTSQLDITGVNSATTNTIMSAYGSGVVGIGISSSYTATRLNVVDDALAGSNMVNLTSTSTGAASNAQKMLNISLSGANGTSAQSTYGAYISNAHTGTTAVNYGIYSTATGAASTNYGVYGEFTGTTGVGYGVYGNGGTNGASGIRGQTANATGKAGYFDNTSTSATSITLFSINEGGGNAGLFRSDLPSSTNTVALNLTVSTTSSGGAGANGIGGEIQFVTATSNGGSSVQQSNEVISKWADATFATRTSKFIITGVNSATTQDWLTMTGAGALQLNQYGAGTLTTDGSGNVTAVSDVRLKDVQGNYTTGIDAIMNIHPITYKWNEKSGFDRNGTYIGFSAQNIQSVLGENAIGRNSQGYLSIQDRAILATLTNAVKQQQLEIEQLQKEIILLKIK